MNLVIVILGCSKEDPRLYPGIPASSQNLLGTVSVDHLQNDKQVSHQNYERTTYKQHIQMWMSKSCSTHTLLCTLDKSHSKKYYRWVYRYQICMLTVAIWIWRQKKYRKQLFFLYIDIFFCWKVIKHWSFGSAIPRFTVSRMFCCKWY